MDDAWWTRPDQLDEDQLKVIGLPADGNFLVVGPPGSGKTNLALLRASYLAQSGKPNIAVLTYTRVLKEFLRSGTEATALDPQKIQTFNGWGRRLLKQIGDDSVSPRDFEAAKEQLVSALEQVPDQVAHEQKFDCLLLDEAQDYSAREIRVFERFSRQLFAVGDGRQQLYDSTGGLDELTRICGTPHRLRYNYRNGRKICRLADGMNNELDHRTGMEATCNYDERVLPSTVSVLGPHDLLSQAAQIEAEINTQLRAYPKGIIGILTPRSKNIEALSRYFQKSPLAALVQTQHYTSGYEPMQPSKRVLITTIHGAKGLEFRALHIAALDMACNMPHERRLVYTAITRAKTSLSIYHQRALPGYLEKGLSSLTLPTAPASLDQLFRVS